MVFVTITYAVAHFISSFYSLIYKALYVYVLSLPTDRRLVICAFVNSLFNEYHNFASEQEKDEISGSLQETERWLYNEGNDETVHTYFEKLEDLKQLVDPVENRYKDEEARVQSTRDLLGCIVEHRMSSDSLSPGDKEKIIDECNKAEKWLRDMRQHQDALPKSADPVFWSRDIDSRTQDLNLFDQATKERIIEFILSSALEFSNYGKLMILSLLKGIGNAIMHPKVAPMLSHFMKQYYDERGKSCQRFSNTETRIMCLLLESCVMSSPSGGDDLLYPLLKALQLDGMTSDDPAYIEPCISVLNKLNSQFQLDACNPSAEYTQGRNS